MLPLLSSEQIKETDTFTVREENSSSLELMERASHLVYDKILELFPVFDQVYILCGSGNNGGDGLVLARLFQKAGYPLSVIVQEGEPPRSEENRINLEKIKELPLDLLVWTHDLPRQLKFSSKTLIVDALFGNGLSRKIEEPLADLISFFNQQKGIRIAVDMPSGLYNELPVTENSPVFKADLTLTFQVPKLNLLLSENEAFVGKLLVLDIGLNREFMAGCETGMFFIEKSDISALFPSRGHHQTKHAFGHALLVAGSSGKNGAALLACRSCLRSGVGLTTVHLPKSSVMAMNIIAPEAMISCDEDSDIVSTFPDISYKTAIGIGPGIGTDKRTEQVLINLIQKGKVPLVLDADALNILSVNKNILFHLPVDTILTPHEKEFDRLTKEHKSRRDRLETAKDLASSANCILILKGAYTAIISPDRKIYFNSSGNPGLAKGGSGDVLTGMILSFLAQGIKPLEAALAGVYLHGLAADLCLQDKPERTMLATDIVETIPKAFRFLASE